MRKLISIYRNGNNELRLYQCPNKVSAIITPLDSRNGVIVFSSEKENVEEFIKLGGEKQMLDKIGFNGYKVPFERKNGKIVLYPVNKQKRIIWTNNDYDEWCEAMKDEITDEEITPEYYGFCCEINLQDEFFLQLPDNRIKHTSLCVRHIQYFRH